MVRPTRQIHRESRVNHRRVRLLGAFVLSLLAVTAHAQTYTKPNVRAITAFVRLDPATLDRQIADALTVLRAAKRPLPNAGTRRKPSAS